MKYAFLEPIQVGDFKLKNRIIYTAQGKYLCTPDGFITERYLDYYRNIARGGVALITPGLAVIDPDWPYITQNQPWLNDDKFIPGLKKAVDVMHEEGALVTYQLWHPGESIKNPNVHHTNVTEFTIDEIRAKQKLYVDAAIRCKKAGADGIEFHLAHLYMPNQFFSPRFNKRTDQYGADTIENSLRFSIEIIEEIKRTCRANGDKFMINVKINGNDFIEDGTTPERTAEACVYLEKAGVDLIITSAGGMLSRASYTFDNGREPEGWKVNYAKLAKKKVSIPVAANGTIRHPDFADSIIRDGKCDIVAIGRGLVAEPEWVKKCMEGREDELRYCISCIHCFGVHPMEKSGCSVNPYSKRESLKPELVKDGNGRTVAIVGAGPAGLEAAVTLAERGFKPVIFERADEIGGMCALASLPPYKSRIRWMLEYYKKQIARLGIDLRLSTTADVAAIKAVNPYAVVIAAGSVEWAPPIPGVRENSISVRDALVSPPEIKGKNVVVLGGGATGLETAHMYTVRGNHSTVIEMLPEDPEPTLAMQFTLNDVRDDNVELCYDTKVEKVEPGVVYTENTKTGEKKTFKADLIICSLGIRPNKAVAEEITAGFENVYNIGDSNTCGRIVDAVQAGSKLGYELK